MRCKPATAYLIQLDSNADSIIYKLILENIQKSKQQLILEIPIEQVEKINVIQLNNNEILKQYNFVSKKLSNRIYYDRKDHRLPEWQEFCEWIESLPMAKELILLI